MPVGQAACPETAMQSEFYTWSLPGSPARIHLYLDVVERLGREVLSAFESVPDRAVEIGGILLGRADPDISPRIEIRDFEPFFGDYRSDHRFVLSEADRSKFEDLVATRGKAHAYESRVVGYYRSHNRTGLCLSEEDLTLIRGCFRDPTNVFLIIKPEEDRNLNAGFFFWDEEQIVSEFSFRVFPFAARHLSGLKSEQGFSSPEEAATPVGNTATRIYVQGTPATAFVPPATKAAARPDEVAQSINDAASPADELVEPIGKVAAPVAKRRRVVRLRLRMRPWIRNAGLSLGALALVTFGSFFLKYPIRPTDAPVPATNTNLSALALKVERQGSDLQVTWNRSGSPIQEATAGTLSIRDGEGAVQELQLDATQLHAGSALYRPASNRVEFRLNVTGTNRPAVSESVLMVMPALPSSQQSPASSPGINAAAPARVSGVPPAASGKLQAALNASSGTQDHSRASGGAESGSSRARAEVTSEVFAPPTAARRLTASAETATMDPPTAQSTLPGPAGAVPGSQPQQTGASVAPPMATLSTPAASANQSTATAPYVQARPIRRVRAVVPPNLRAVLTGDVEVAVTVRINESGQVTKVQSVQHTGPLGALVDGPAVTAAKAFLFEPARLGGQAVPSDMTLRFQFPRDRNAGK